MKENYKEIADRYSYHWALGGSDWSGGLEQNKNELLFFCDWMQKNKIKSIIEIGLAQGFFSKFLEEIGIDVLGVTDREDLLKHKPKKLFIGKSAEFAKDIPNADLVFVDGDHSYKGVKADYEAYKGKCKYIAFHDILGLRDCEGVKKFWLELTAITKYQFVDQNRNYASGIGVVEVSEITEKKSKPKGRPRKNAKA